MKKVSTTILAIIYLATSSGATINIHYCMGKLYSIDLGSHSKCGMKKNDTGKGCCKDEIKVIKLRDAQQIASNQIHFICPVTVVNNHKLIPVPVFKIEISKQPIRNNSPPGFSGVSLSVSNCLFLI